MTRRLISMKLPEEVLGAIDRHAKAHGTNRTALVEQALRAVLEGRLEVKALPTPDPTPVGELPSREESRRRHEDVVAYAEKLMQENPSWPRTVAERVAAAELYPRQTRNTLSDAEPLKTPEEHDRAIAEVDAAFADRG